VHLARTGGRHALNGERELPRGFVLDAQHAEQQPLARPRLHGAHGGLALPGFYKLNYTVAGTFTAGALAASLLLNRDDVVNYPSTWRWRTSDATGAAGGRHGGR
jgi:hypothetical protein